jgi:hypothetical protein
LGCYDEAVYPPVVVPDVQLGIALSSAIPPMMTALRFGLSALLMTDSFFNTAFPPGGKAKTWLILPV